MDATVRYPAKKTSHFRKEDGSVWEVDYLVYPRPDGSEAHFKLHRSERPCQCEKGGEKHG